MLSYFYSIINTRNAERAYISTNGGEKMKKYRITKQISSGIPFTLRDFDDFHKCYIYFLKIVNMEKENVNAMKSSGYYVLNEFYKNEFVLSANCIKLKIEKRSRKEWKILRLQDI